MDCASWKFLRELPNCKNQNDAGNQRLFCSRYQEMVILKPAIVSRPREGSKLFEYLIEGGWKNCTFLLRGLKNYSINLSWDALYNTLISGSWKSDDCFSFTDSCSFSPIYFIRYLLTIDIPHWSYILWLELDLQSMRKILSPGVFSQMTGSAFF